MPHTTTPHPAESDAPCTHHRATYAGGCPDCGAGPGFPWLTVENDAARIDYAAVLAVLLTADDPADELRDLMAEAWDEGFMNAAGQDHPAYPRTRRMDNPYERPIPPDQTAD